jgi:hypothetical protein
MTALSLAAQATNPAPHGGGLRPRAIDNAAGGHLRRVISVGAGSYD